MTDMSTTNTTVKDPSEYTKRAPTVANTAAYGYMAGTAVATMHWLAKCFSTGHFVFQMPDDALIETWAFLLLPVAHVIGKIVMNRLNKIATQGE